MNPTIPVDAVVLFVLQAMIYSFSLCEAARSAGSRCAAHEVKLARK